MRKIVSLPAAWVIAWLVRLTDFIFGYDIFISYAWNDGSQYPQILNQQLKAARFKTFLDKTDYVPGIDLQQATRRRVRMSTVLLVIVRPHALQSPWVLKEAEESLAARHSVIPIDINRAFESAADDRPLKALLINSLRIRENIPALDDPPSKDTLAEILRRFTFIRRETLQLWAILATAAVLLTALGIGSYQYVQARKAERAKRVSQIVSETNGLASDPAQLDKAVEKAGEVASSTTLGVVPVFRKFLSLWPPVDVREITCDSNKPADCNIDVLKFSPSGSRLAIGTGSGNVLLVELQNPRRRLVTKHAKGIQYILFSNDGRWLLSLAPGESSVQVCATDAENCFQTPACGKDVAAMAVAPATMRNTVALGAENKICVVDVDGRTILHEIPTASPVRMLSFSTATQLLAAVMPRKVQLWSTANWRLNSSAALPEWEVAKLDPTLSRIVVSRNEESFIVGTSSGKVLSLKHPDFIKDIDVNPAGTQFVTASANLRGTEYAARLFSFEDISRFHSFAQQGQVTRAEFLPDGSHLLTASGPYYPYDGFARLWNVNSSQPLAVMINDGPVTAFASNRSGKIATGSWNGVVKIWDTWARNMKDFDFGERILQVRFNPVTEDAVIFYRLENSEGAIARISKSGQPQTKLDMISVDDVAYSSNGELLAVAGDSTVTVFRGIAGPPLAKFPLEKAIEFCRFAGRDKIVVYLKDEIHVIGVETGKHETFNGGGEPLAATPDGDKVAIGTVSNVELLDLSTHKQIPMPEGAGAVSSAALSADGRTLAAGYRKNFPREGFFGPGICLWKTRQATLSGCIRTANGIISVAFHPTENILVSGDEFGTLQAWDLQSNGELFHLQYSAPVQSISFDSTGRVLKVALYGPTSKHVEIESAPWNPESLLRESCLRAARPMNVCANFK